MKLYRNQITATRSCEAYPASKQGVRISYPIARMAELLIHSAGLTARLLAAVFVLFAMSAQAQDASESNSIRSLDVSAPAGGKVVIKVELKNALSAPPASFTINTPPRIALDFPGTANGLGKSTQEFNQGSLRSANIVQAGNRTRLVVNLNQMLPYETRVEGNNLLITLQEKVAEAPVAASRFAEPQPNAQAHALSNIDFHRGRNGEGRIQVDLSDANVGIDIKQQGKSLIVSFMKTSLPRNLQRKLDVTDFATPVEGIDTYADGDNVRMVIQPKGAWEHAAYQADNKFIVEIKPVADDPNRLVKAGYSGEKLTLNFQNIAVREALYVIGDFINSNDIPMNLIISDSVTGSLTLRLKDVPWDQALDIILQSKGLDMRKSGNVIQIAPREEIAAKEKLSLAANQEISDLEPLRTESFPLSYQKSADVIKILSDKDQRILSKRGSVVTDARTNTLFIKDTPTALEEVRKMLKQIDVPVKQVMIEARFVAAADNFNRTLGVRLGYTGPGVAAGGGFGVGAGQRGAVTNVNLPGATAGTGQLSLALFNPAATKTLTLELSASEIDGTSKNIASPRVVTADGMAANIQQGVQIPYTTVSSSGTQTQFANATLGLGVTPHITPDNNVNMELNVTNNSVGQSYGGIPSQNINTVTTNVLVENGGTVVIGGVYKRDETSGTTQLPVLGDIPLLGWLFKNKNVTDNKTELLVFITPKVLKETLSMQ